MSNPILTRAIDAVASRRDLSAEETAEVLSEIMHGEVSETQIAGFLIALRTKGETVDELAGLARTMRALAAHVPTERDDLLDTAGTGGGKSTFNVSTTAALIAAGAGCAVAKHGNRSATSRSGSADLLEALGARIDLDPAAVARCIDEAGFGFMFAPSHHQATRFVIPVRRELAVRTIFNLLGPLTNPAGARRQLIGVSDARFLETIAGALARLGVDHAMVVAGEDGTRRDLGRGSDEGRGGEGRGDHAVHARPGRCGNRAGRRSRASAGARRGSAGGERGAHPRDPRGRRSRGRAAGRRGPGADQRRRGDIPRRQGGHDRGGRGGGPRGARGRGRLAALERYVQASQAYAPAPAAR